MADDEDLRIKALREELMRRVDTIEQASDTGLGEIRKELGTLKWLMGILVAVFGLIAAILAAAANII